MVKQRAREWRQLLWATRRAEEAMQLHAADAEQQAAVKAALIKKDLEDEISAIRAAEDAEKHRMEV